MNMMAVLTISLAAACTCGQAQEPTAKGAGNSLPAFEAASIKPSPPVERSLIVDGVPAFRPMPHMRGGPGTNDPAQITCMHCPLSVIIATAYEVGLFQIRSARNVNLGEYDLIAKVPAGSTRDQVNLMLRQLLVERFELTLHNEKQDGPAYVLAVGKRGPKFQQSPDSATGPETSGPDGPTLHPTLRADGLYTLIGEHKSMKELADALSLAMHRPVVDMTELKGNYEFLLAWMANERMPQPKKSELPAGIEAAPYSPQAAVEFQLGLKLEARKVPVAMLIVDSALKAPIEN